MTSAIGGSTHVSMAASALIKPQQPPAVRIDSDGDHDGSKPVEVEKKAASGTIGTVINTKA